MTLQGPAMALRRDVQAGAQNLKDKLSIELQPPDNRRGTVRYGLQVFNAKVKFAYRNFACIRRTFLH